MSFCVWGIERTFTGNYSKPKKTKNNIQMTIKQFEDIDAWKEHPTSDRINRIDMKNFSYDLSRRSSKSEDGSRAPE